MIVIACATSVDASVAPSGNKTTELSRAIACLAAIAFVVTVRLLAGGVRLISVEDELEDLANRGYLPDGKNSEDFKNGMPEAEFCKRYNCKQAQKVIIKFNLKD